MGAHSLSPEIQPVDDDGSKHLPSPGDETPSDQEVLDWTAEEEKRLVAR